MKRQLAFVLLLAVAAASAEPSRLLQNKRSAALTRIETELVALSKVASRGKAFGRARRELQKGLALHPESKRLVVERDRIAEKTGTPKAGFEARFLARQEKAYAKCGKVLADLALAFDRKGHVDEFERWASAVQTHFPSKAALKRLQLVYFEPYLKWVRKKDAERLAKGSERVDGKWIDKDAVAALNARHATFEDPWVLSDEVHELKTTVPLREARQLLAHIGIYREFVLRQFSGAWDLRPPKGKLPVIVTRTQAELRARMEAATGQSAPPQLGAAFYLQSNSALNPCFVTLEPMAVDGRAMRVGVKDTLHPLKHELAHQIAFEYCKYDYNQSRGIEFHFWCVEGLANYLEWFVYEAGTWRLSKPNVLKMGENAVQGAFAWCVQNRGAIPPVWKFMRLTQQEFVTVENYHISATLAWFLLEGEGGKYRESFLRLLDTVHKVRDEPRSFEACFPGVEMEALQKEWEAFLDGIEIDKS